LHASSIMKKQAVDSFEILATCHGVKIQKSTIIDDACLLLAYICDGQHTHLLMYVAVNVRRNMHVFSLVFESVNQITVKHC
jgi:hypothetical protein